MIILGCSETHTLREKLFGTIPEKLVNQADGLNIGVIRAARPTGHRVRETFGRLIRVRIPQLERSERLAFFEEIESKSRWSFDFAVLMTLAALVAGLGLLANSGAVVIGAMLIAPLMMPLIGSGLALAQGNTPLFKNSISAVIRGFLCALLAGIFLGGTRPLFPHPAHCRASRPWRTHPPRSRRRFRFRHRRFLLHRTPHPHRSTGRGLHRRSISSSHRHRRHLPHHP